MSFGELAYVGFPAEILTVNERDGLVGLLVWLMIFVCVKTRLRGSIVSCATSSFFINIFIYFLFNFLFLDMRLVSLLFGWFRSALSLNFCLLNWLSSNFVLGSNDCNFDGIRLSFD